MNNCKNCSRALQAQAKGWIMCSYWQSKWEESKQPINIFQNEIPANLILATGWASRTKYINTKSYSWIQGTATDGIIYSNQLLVEENCCCDNYMINNIQEG